MTDNIVERVREATALEKARNTIRLVHHYWLIAAKEALQGDMGKLRRHVAITEGKTYEDVIAEMTAALGIDAHDK